MVVKLINGPMADTIENDETVHDYFKTSIAIENKIRKY